MDSTEQCEARGLSRAIDARLAGRRAPHRRPQDLDGVIHLLAARAATTSPAQRRSSAPRSVQGSRWRLAVPVMFALLALIAIPVVAQKGILIHRAGNIAVYEEAFPSAPPNVAPPAKIDTLSLAQAQQHVTFTIPTPSWLPPGYTVVRAQVIESNSLYESVSVLYREATAAASNGGAFQILYNHYIGSGTTCYQFKEGTRICDRYSHPAPQGSVIADVTINGQPALLIEDTANDARSVEFEQDGISIAVAGPASLPADAFIRIATGLR